MNWNSVESGIRQQLIERLKTMSVGDLKDLSGRGILEIFANVQKDLNVRPAFTRSVKWAYKCRWEALRDVPIEVMTEHVEHRYKNGLLIAAQQPTDTHGGREVDVAEAEIVHGAAAHGDDSDKMAADLRKVHHSTDTRCLRRSSRLKKKCHEAASDNRMLIMVELPKDDLEMVKGAVTRNLEMKKFKGIEYGFESKKLNIDENPSVKALQQKIAAAISGSKCTYKCASSIMRTKLQPFPRGPQTFHRDYKGKTACLHYFSVAPISKSGCFLFVLSNGVYSLIYIPYGYAIICRGDVIHAGGIACEGNDFPRLHTYLNAFNQPDRGTTDPVDEQPEICFDDKFSPDNNIWFDEELDNRLGSHIGKAVSEVNLADTSIDDVIKSIICNQ